MEMQYEIMLGDKAVGKAEVYREGLYYRIRCRCELSGETVCRVAVRCGDRTESLGILVPEGRKFGLQTRIPVKKIGEGPLSFAAVPKHGPVEGRFVPLSPEEPFRYISKLKDAYLERRNGTIGVVIKEPGRV